MNIASGACFIINGTLAPISGRVGQSAAASVTRSLYDGFLSRPVGTLWPDKRNEKREAGSLVSYQLLQINGTLSKAFSFDDDNPSIIKKRRSVIIAGGPPPPRSGSEEY